VWAKLELVHHLKLIRLKISGGQLVYFASKKHFLIFDIWRGGEED